MANFIARLKQRKLVQWALAYIAAAFALIQVIDVVADSYDWPHLVMHLVFGVLVVGFVVLLLLAWYHGERGAQRTSGPELLLIALALAIGGGLLWHFGRAGSSAGSAEVATTARASTTRRAATTGGSTPSSATSGAMESASPAAAIAARAIPAKSVAVLPFVNESGDPRQRYFSDGLSEDLITALSQFTGLKVISRNSAFQFRDSKASSAEVGKALGVAHLLEGSVQRAGDEVRITATLVKAADGSILWSARYDKPYQDLFALQDDITHSVADALQAKLLATHGAAVQGDRPPSGNLAAWAAFQHGQTYAALGTQASLRQAIAAYQEAIHLDPGYATAYATLSGAWIELWSAGAAGTGLTLAGVRAKATAAADTALGLDPDSSRAHLARAYLLLSGMDWQGAEAEARRAVQLAPNDPDAQFWMATTLATLGHGRPAVGLIRKALTADPRHAPWYKWLGIYLAGLGQLEQARAAANQSIALQPGATDFHEQLAVIEILRGDAKAALAAAQHEVPGVWREIALALALQIGSNRPAADAAMAKLIADHADDAPYQIAEVYALRGDANDTFKWLNRAWSDRDGGIGSLLFDPIILRYQHDPRFAAFCKQVGLPATTDAVAIK